MVALARDFLDAPFPKRAPHWRGECDVLREEREEERDRRDEEERDDRPNYALEDGIGR